MEFKTSAEKFLFTAMQKLIPAETFQLLQPENLKQLLGAFAKEIGEIKAQQLRIEQNQQLILDILNERNGSDGGNSTLIGNDASPRN